ncbi:MAG TPA: glycosyltransferase family 1 protein [Vicinamibacteria bacterium]
MAARPLVVGVDGRELAERPTGTGRYLRNLLRHWRDSGDELVVYFNGPPALDPVLDHERVRKRPLGDGRARGLVYEQWLLPRAARADPLDVFFSPAYSCPLGLDVPRVTAVHDLSFFAYPQDFTLAEALRRRALVVPSMRASRRIPVCSDFTARELRRLFPDLAERAAHVPLGADGDLAQSLPRAEARAALGLGGPLVLSVGAIFNRRCLPELLRAVLRLRERHPGLVLEVVGDNRTHPRLDLEALVATLGLGGTVRLTGFVDDRELALRYAAADAFVSLSEYEGFGLPALEAAARGVPLVVGRAPSLGEIFRDAAIAVDPRDEEAVARALDRVLRDGDARAALVAAGRALAARHSWAETARLTRELLVEAAGA